MRRIISKFLVLVMLLNMFALEVVFAEVKTMLYIDGGVGTESAFSDENSAFVELQQLYRLNLTYESTNNGVKIHNDENSLDLFSESNVIIKNGESCGFNNALYISDSKICGVNASLLCKVFGYDYEYDGENVRINTIGNDDAISTFSDVTAPYIVSGKICLPNEMSAETDTAITVFIRDADAKNKVVVSQIVHIASSGNTADFSLTVPEVVTRISLAYRLSDRSNLYRVGYYSQNGTSIESPLAKTMTLTKNVSDIMFYIIPTKKITAEITMPQGRVAADDIRANVYVVPEITYGIGSEHYFSLKTSEVIIQKGSTVGTATFDVPLQSNVKYKLGVRFTVGDDSVFSNAYYGANGSVSSKYIATAVDDTVSEVNIPLIQKNTISGTVNNAQGAFVIYAIGQDTTGAKKNLRSATFYTTTYSALGTGAYSLNVPNDVEKYIIGFQYTNEAPSQMRYYSEKGLTTDISLANVVSVENDTNGINIQADKIYEGGPVKFYGYSQNYSGTFDIGYKNLSDKAQNGIHAMAAYYSNNKLIGVSKTEKNFAVGECGTLHFNTSVLAGKTVDTVKVFAWETGYGCTASKVKLVDWSVDTHCYTSVYENSRMVFGADNRFVYACNAIMAPVADAASVFGTNVISSGDTITFTKDSVSVTFTKGSVIVSVNGSDEMAEAVTAPIGTEVMVPIEVLARSFGYSVHHNTVNDILYITN